MRIAYDFHIHSCLSPCGDNDMTPNNIVNMAMLKGLDAIALTDHNSCRNCRATVRAGARAGLLVLPGMELCTAEDIHCVCLFASVENAEAFGEAIHAQLPPVENRPDIFGDQLVLDDEDNVVGRENLLLLNAAAVAFDDVRRLVISYGGAAFPAHADRPSNGVIGILGALPEEAGFTAAEISPSCDRETFLRENPSLAKLTQLRDSDAHDLGQISERENYLELESLSVKTIISALNRANIPENP